MSYEKVKQAKEVVVGVKQTKKAIERGRALYVVFANDADRMLTGPLEAICKKNDVSFTYVPSMRELGKASGIQVGTAVVAVLAQKLPS